MNEKDFQQHISAIKQLLGAMQIPADERHVGIMAQVYTLLANMNDECDIRVRQELIAQAAQPESAQ